MDWTALPVGIVIASLATMVGLGGGILWTPYLIFAAGLSPSEAVFTSLVIQIAGMGSGGVAAIRKKRTNPKLAGMLAAASLPGVAAGVWLQGVIAPESLVFILGMACMATALVFVYAREEFDLVPVREVPPRAIVPYLWVPPALSVLTGLLSIGVGDFLVPVLRNRLGMKMDAAIGSCLIVMCINAAVAAVLHLAAGEWFERPLVLWALAGVIIGGQIGPRLADKVSDQTLKEIFIYGLSLVGIHVLFNA
jgi:uncharacterized membrane protein YfcA